MFCCGGHRRSKKNGGDNDLEMANCDGKLEKRCGLQNWRRRGEQVSVNKGDRGSVTGEVRLLVGWKPSDKCDRGAGGAARTCDLIKFSNCTCTT